MKNKLLKALSVVGISVLAFVGIVALVDSSVVAPNAQAQDDFTLGPSVKIFDTQTATTSEIVTNKAIATTVVGRPSKVFVAKGKDLYVQFNTKDTPFTAGTNVSVVLSSSAFQTSVRTNRVPFFTNTITTHQFATNVLIAARPYIYVDAVTPTGVTLTNAQIYLSDR